MYRSMSYSIDEDENVIGGLVTLNNTFNVPVIGFGTRDLPKHSVRRAIESALLSGYRLFDTSQAYGNQLEIGNALQGVRRTDIFLSSHIVLDADDDVAVSIREQVDGAICTLGTSFLDVVSLSLGQCEKKKTEEEQRRRRRLAYQELEILKGVIEYGIDERKVRAIALCDFQLEMIIENKLFAKYPPQIVQLENHPHHRDMEILKYCNKAGIFVQAHQPLGRACSDLLKEEVLKQIADRNKATVQVTVQYIVYRSRLKQILLAWQLHSGIGILTKSANPNHVSSNIGAVDLTLTDSDLLAISGIEKRQSYANYCEDATVMVMVNKKTRTPFLNKKF